jgi:hypothetical protein
MTKKPGICPRADTVSPIHTSGLLNNDRFVTDIDGPWRSGEGRDDRIVK